MSEHLILRHADGRDELVTSELLLHEKRCYTLVCAQAQQLFLGSRPLRRAGDAWLLPIEFWVGGNVLRVKLADGEQTFGVKVLPDPQKLTELTWEAIVHDLEAYLSGLTVGLSGGRAGSASGSRVSLNLVTEALLPLIPALLRSLREVLADPKEETHTHRGHVPLHRTRQVERETIVWLGHQPHAAAHLRPGVDDSRAGAPPFVPVQRGVETLDHPVNRYTAWLCWRIERTLRECARLWAEHTTGNDDSAEWARARSIACAEAATKLSRMVRSSFLRDLRRQPPSDTALLVATNAPNYAKFQRIARRFLTPMFDPRDSDNSPVALRESYGLYELWCLLEVQRALSDVVPSMQWKQTEEQTEAQKRKLLSGTGRGVKFEAITTKGRAVTLEFNPTFSSFWTCTRNGERKRRWSLSGERRPDIVLTARGGDASPVWLILDAKYRVTMHALADAFSSVHIYRDSLRDDTHGGKVGQAALLAPTKLAETAGWFDEDFFAEHRCGVFELRPQVGASRLGTWLAGVLGL